VLCAVTIPPADLRSLSLYYYTVYGRMCMSFVIQQFLRIISGVHNIQDMEIETFCSEEDQNSKHAQVSRVLMNCLLGISPASEY
jgi:hypothetical protein